MKEETSVVDFVPEKTIVIFTGRSMTMRDLKDLTDTIRITIGDKAKRGLGLADELEGAINVIIFFQGKTA